MFKLGQKFGKESSFGDEWGKDRVGDVCSCELRTCGGVGSIDGGRNDDATGVTHCTGTCRNHHGDVDDGGEEDGPKRSLRNGRLSVLFEKEKGVGSCKSRTGWVHYVLISEFNRFDLGAN